MAKRKKIKCSFLISNIGEILLDELKKHISDCRDCQKELKDAHRIYLQPGKCGVVFEEKFSLYNFDDLPKELDKEGFLKAWHISQSIKDEDLAAAKIKLYSVGGAQMMRELLEAYSSTFRFIALETPSIVVEKNVEITARMNEELQGLLGKDGFSFLIGDIDSIAKGWLIVLQLLKMAT